MILEGVPSEYTACERQAIGQLIRHCFGDTLPGTAMVSVLRIKPEHPPDTIHCTVLVDGQEIGAAVGTWIGESGDRPNAYLFTLFPKYNQ
jgi:hypothetical protein